MEKVKKIYRDYDPEFCKYAAILTAAGATQKKLAQVFNVSIDTLRKWKREHKEFKDALLKGKEEVRNFLLSKGLDMAVGYDYVEKCEKPVRVKNEDGTFSYENHPYYYTKHQSGDSKLWMILIDRIERLLGSEDWRPENKLQLETTIKTPAKLEAAQKEQIALLAGKLTKFVESKEVKCEK